MREIKFEYVSRAVRDVPPTPFNNLPIRKGDTRRNIYTLDEIQAGTIHLHHQDTKGDVFELVARREYTGLKDKNGVEIYEGDLLDIKSAGGDRGYVPVVFRDASFMMHIPYWVNDYYHLSDYDSDLYEVIGNIYENSEPLEENQ